VHAESTAESMNPRFNPIGPNRCFNPSGQLSKTSRALVIPPTRKNVVGAAIMAAEMRWEVQ